MWFFTSSKSDPTPPPETPRKNAENETTPDDIAENGEQTPLFVIMPSAQSTKGPSLTNLQTYQALGDKLVKKGDEDERSATSLDVYTPLKKSQPSTSSFSLCDSFICSLPAKICAAIVIVVAVGIIALLSANHTTTAAKFGFHHPISTLSPINDLKVLPLSRPANTHPPQVIIRKNATDALPTNIWYMNYMMTGTGQPSNFQNVYTVPYLVDVAGVIPGIHISPQEVSGRNTLEDMISNPMQGAVLGVDQDVSTNTQQQLSKTYTVPTDLSSPLAVTLDWDVFPMSSTIVRGMPYGTMHYQKGEYTSNGTVLLPTFAAQVPLRDAIVVDGNKNATCGSTSPSHFKVQKEIMMTFSQSDFTWMLFFSEPVWIQCISNGSFGNAKTLLQVRSPSNLLTDDLTIRLALVSTCTTGTNPIFCKGQVNEAAIDSMIATLRKHADVYPGPKANFAYEVDNDKNEAMVTFDWDPRSLFDKTSVKNMGGSAPELITFAMPHHMDSFGTTPADYAHCTRTFLGDACIVTGSVWKLPHELPPVSFWASTPPSPEYLPQVADALRGDINFTLPLRYQAGGGDTYFSGKMLGKLARILLIGQQLFDVCANPTQAYSAACKQAVLPTKAQFDAGIARLRSNVEVWFNGTGMTPFVYDANWGGYISCGCIVDHFNNGCANSYPDCPDASNPGLNFGNGFYNDHHFHYGYFIYASAAVAYFDPAWGRKNFDKINLWVRDIANPSSEDTYFTVTRHKDWYRGHSWAGGLPIFIAGRNQESTSEALNAYEGVSLYGEVMVRFLNGFPTILVGSNLTSLRQMDAWKQVNDHQKLATAEEIRDVGKILLATELQSVQEYWHVKNNSTIIEPLYTENVVGIVWSVQAVFGTWFGTAPYLPYGIQLLPITAISQQRDNPDWTRDMYAPFANSCNADPVCKSDGWSILELCVLAEVGHTQDAFDRTLDVPPSAFLTHGGNGHSLTNTLWYISTRPKVQPLKIVPPPPPKPVVVGPPGAVPAAQKHVTNCGLPQTCTPAVLNTMAGGFTCATRMDWLMNFKGDSEKRACAIVGGLEFPKECGACATSFAKATPSTSFNCGLPGKCTNQVLATDASGHTCMSRIKFLIDSQGVTEQQACYQVGGFEFPSLCGACSPKKPPVIKASLPTSKLPGIIDCGHPAQCTGKALNNLAAGFTCLSRMTWLMSVKKFNELDACSLVAAVEYPQECGACNPAV